MRDVRVNRHRRRHPASAPKTARHRARITNAIHQEVRERVVVSACDINEGGCVDFAQSVAERVPGAKVVYLEDVVEEESDLNHLPYHVWVEYKGKFYDAETPEGVTEWQDLSTFAGYYQPHRRRA